MLRATKKLNEWLSVNEPDYSRISRKRHKEIYASLPAKYPETAYDVTALRIRHLEHSFLELGYSNPNAHKIALEAFQVFMHWRCQVEPYAGVVPLLEELKEHYLLATITNGNSDISKTSIAPYFEISVDAATAGAAKPDSQIFEYTLDNTGVENPSSAVHIGDNYEDDYVGALNAGLKALLYDPNEVFVGEKDSVISVESLSLIPAVVKELS